ncbi:MAG: hypothetical protein A2X94_06600 [Bdellovibrionales bacterium GWB1_55_8]|nr:MAG: hypothetical protein A2X94_06600 [Bdellovibrionales bacterium GWB1_55_8]
MVTGMMEELSLFDLFRAVAPKIAFAVLCGGVIGLERELKSKPAGIKTNILICVGAMLYTWISILISRSASDVGQWGDPARVAAQIVSGIGFLCGGAIIQSRGTVLGLTTAATIWVVAAIGIAIGVERLDIALFSTVSVLVVLVVINLFEDKILGRSLRYTCEIVLEDPKGEVRTAIHKSLERNDLELDDFDIAARGELSVITCRYRGHSSDQKKFLIDLLVTTGIREVRQL